MILTEYVMYKGKQKKVSELSPTCNYKVDVMCPECKSIRNVFYKSVCKAGHTTCQACIVKQNRKIIEVGESFGRLTVIGEGSKSGRSICRCECGDTKEVENWSLVSGKTKSCGCLRSENIKKVSHNPKGEEHWHWKGGITGERHSAMSQKPYKDWRASVFERDDYTCQKCGQVGRELRAHHIFNFADNHKIRLDVDNGITFCENCHREFHRINGFKTNKEQLDNFVR